MKKTRKKRFYLEVDPGDIGYRFPASAVVYCGYDSDDTLLFGEGSTVKAALKNLYKQVSELLNELPRLQQEIQAEIDKTGKRVKR